MDSSPCHQRHLPALPRRWIALSPWPVTGGQLSVSPAPPACADACCARPVPITAPPSDPAQQILAVSYPSVSSVRATLRSCSVFLQQFQSQSVPPSAPAWSVLTVVPVAPSSSDRACSALSRPLSPYLSGAERFRPAYTMPGPCDAERRRDMTKATHGSSPPVSASLRTQPRNELPGRATASAEANHGDWMSHPLF